MTTFIVCRQMIDDDAVSQTAKQGREDGRQDVIASISMGQRLIVCHAITKDGPLTEVDENDCRVKILVWNKDTCHPEDQEDGKINCEALWIAQSKSGDCHDTMNSELFLKGSRRN
jgi:hypothetical protein